MIKIKDLIKLGFDTKLCSEDEFYYALDINTELEGIRQISLITNKLTKYDTKANVYEWGNQYEVFDSMTYSEIKNLINLSLSVKLAKDDIYNIINKKRN